MHRARNLDFNQTATAVSAALTRHIDRSTMPLHQEFTICIGTSPRVLVFDLIIMRCGNPTAGDSLHRKIGPFCEASPVWWLAHVICGAAMRVGICGPNDYKS